MRKIFIAIIRDKIVISFICKELIQIGKASPESPVNWKESLREQASAPRENFVNVLLYVFIGNCLESPNLVMDYPCPWKHTSTLEERNFFWHIMIAMKSNLTYEKNSSKDTRQRTVNLHCFEVA